MSKEQTKEEKGIMVVDKIVSIDMSKRQITFSWQEPDYFSKEHQEWVDNVFKKLLKQQLGGELKITGLTLKFWEEK